MRIFITTLCFYSNVWGEILELEEGRRTGIVDGRYNGTGFSQADADLGHFLSSKAATLSIESIDNEHRFTLEVQSIESQPI